MKSPPGTVPATSLVVASMIGTGVFTSLGFQLLDLNSGPQILYLWLLGGLIALCGALCYAAVAEALPKSGGEHHFLGRMYHPSLGFMAGMLSAISGFAAPTAITAMAFGAYLNKSLPGVPAQAAAIGVILIGSAAHMVDSKTSAVVQTAATAIKLLLILAFLAAAFLLPGEGDIRWPIDPGADFAATVSPAFAVALMWVLYSYSGWNAAVYGLETWDQPAKTVRRALIIGTGLVTVLYIGLNAAFLKAAPTGELRGVIPVGEVAAVSLFGKSAASWISMLFSLGLFASVSALLWAGPHVLSAMGRTTPGLAFFNPKDGSPRLALACQTGLALALVTLNRFDDLVTFTTIGLTLCTMLTVFGVFRLERPHERWRRPWFPAGVFLAMTAFILFYSIINKPWPSGIGLACVAVLSLIGHFIHRRTP
ncbi:APC family permease [Haloferula helveola]